MVRNGSNGSVPRRSNLSTLVLRAAHGPPLCVGRSGPSRPGSARQRRQGLHDALRGARRLFRAPRPRLARGRGKEWNEWFIHFFKLREARSPLYRRRILQINIRWNSYLFVGKLLTRSTRFTCFYTAQTSIFQKFFVKNFRIFWQNFAKIRYFWILFTDFCSDFDEILSEFRR